jgi:hypothetical protein
MKWLAEIRFITFSLLIHTILLLAFSTVILTSAKDETEDFSAGDGSLLVETTALAPPPERPADSQPREETPAAAASMQVSTPAFETISSTSLQGSFAVASGGVKASLQGLGTGSITDVVKGHGSGVGGMGGLAGSMRFFGTQATGQKIVIVIDVSGSMVRGKKSGKSYAVLENEVIRVLQDMELKASFGLIVFSREAKAYRPQLVKATSEEKERGAAWLKKKNPIAIDDPKSDPETKAFHQGTRADLGLAEAFNLAPDLIFFVSDGEPTGATPQQILASVAEMQKNLPHPAPIHAVAFMADGGQRFMKELAGQNNGTFREVNPRDVP